jgi:Mn2+/Fe2+ NRAMP family transporter
VVAVFIVVATATTPYATGTTISSAADAAAALGPVAGGLSTLLFSIALRASVLAATIMP